MGVLSLYVFHPLLLCSCRNSTLQKILLIFFSTQLHCLESARTFKHLYLQDTDSIETLVEDRLPGLQMLPLTEESLLPENEEEESGEEAIQLQQSSTKKPVSAKKRKRAPNNNDEMLQMAVSYLGTASEHISKRREEREPDEEEIFSKYIANELRQISDGHIKRVAKHKIENILFEAHCSSMDASFPQKGQFLS